MRWVGVLWIKIGKGEGIYIVSIAPIVAGLMVVAALHLCVDPRLGHSCCSGVCAGGFVGGRWMLQRQVSKDFVDLYMSQDGFKKTGKPEYLDFIRLRTEQMLRDSKALTSAPGLRLYLCRVGRGSSGSYAVFEGLVTGLHFPKYFTCKVF